MTTGAMNDSVHEALNKLFSEIYLEHQKINALKPPEEDKKHLVESILSGYVQNRGQNIFYNYVSSGRGHGPFTELVDGSVKYDLIGSMGINLLGHSHPLFIKATLEAATVDTIMCGNLMPYQNSVDITDAILATVKKSRLKHFWFAGSGSFANDLALKILWQKTHPKSTIVAFEKAFAGRSVATQDITYNPKYRDGMPKSLDVVHVPHYNQEDPDNSLKNTLSALNEAWKKDGKNLSAISLELVQGEGGFIFGTKEYYTGICKWAKEHDLYIWIDEVQTFTRTTQLFAFQMFELDEYVDIVTVGKALQLCGVLYSDELNPRPGLIAGTFNGSITSLNAGSAILKYLTEGNFYGEGGRIKEIEDKFIEKLRALASSSCRGFIKYFGGVGTMISFEIGESSVEQSSQFIKRLFDNGIISFMAGRDPTRIRFLLPISLTDEHIDEIFLILQKTAQEFME
jgi:4-aminobutyrate aminotransferase-like enzyme